MNSRSFSFFLIDKFKGGFISRRIKLLKQLLLQMPYSDLKAYQETEWQKLRKHVQSSVPFYKNLTGNRLEDFPVTNKAMIRENLEDFLSESFEREKLTFQQTSGSTGTPFRVYQNTEKRKAHQADNIFFNELAGLKLGSRMYYFRIWDKLVHKTGFTFFLQNVVPVDSSDLSCPGLERNFYLLLQKEKQPCALLAYSSTFECMSKCLKDEFRSENVSSIITMSETLPSGSRKELEAFFRCRVYSRYSNMENGFIAQENPYQQGYLINEASYLVECLEMDSDTPAKLGETGRIVVTDLFNYAMPLIRYDTGDLGAFSKKSLNGVERLFIEQVEGRRVDFIFDEQDKLVSPHVITNTMWRYNTISQFQFVQVGKGNYIMRLNGEKFTKETEKELESDLKNYLGQSIQLELDYVDEIPLLASGKRKKIVNEYRIP